MPALRDVVNLSRTDVTQQHRYTDAEHARANTRRRQRQQREREVENEQPAQRRIPSLIHPSPAAIQCPTPAATFSVPLAPSGSSPDVRPHAGLTFITYCGPEGRFLHSQDASHTSVSTSSQVRRGRPRRARQERSEVNQGHQEILLGSVPLETGLPTPQPSGIPGVVIGFSGRQAGDEPQPQGPHTVQVSETDTDH